MFDLNELLNEMRGRLGMYIGATSITELAAFLRGYDYAMVQLGLGKEDRFLAEFRDWIHERFQTTAHSWEKTILLHSADEADAVEHFWKLFDEYLERRNGELGARDRTDGSAGTANEPQTASKKM